MKAATIRRYGGPEVLSIEDLPEPVAGPGEVRVRVTAAGVTAADARLRANDAPRGFGFLMRCFTGLVRPRHPVFGMEFAGVVDALGAGAAGFTLGQRAFGITGIKGGAHAQYLARRAPADQRRHRLGRHRRDPDRPPSWRDRHSHRAGREPCLRPRTRGRRHDRLRRGLDQRAMGCHSRRGATRGSKALRARHPLAVLATRMPWADIEAALARCLRTRIAVVTVSRTPTSSAPLHNLLAPA